MSDRVELTAAEREALAEAGGTTIECRCEFCLNTEAAVESIVAARVQEYAEKFESLSDRAKTAATELGAKNDRLAAELAAANARCAELEADRAEYEPRLRELTASLIEARAETAAFRKSNEDWRDTAGEAIAEQEAAQREARSWESNYNTLKAENAHLQATLDRISALADECEKVPPANAEMNAWQRAHAAFARSLRAALTPEGTE